MKRSWLAVVVTLAVAAASFSISVSAQTGAMPKTPWGEPDLQGTWTNETITPFERPADMAGQAVSHRGRGRGRREEHGRRSAPSADEAPVPAGRRGQLQPVLVRLGNQGRRDAADVTGRRSAGRSRAASRPEAEAAAREYATRRRATLPSS